MKIQALETITDLSAS